MEIFHTPKKVVLSFCHKIKLAKRAPVDENIKCRDHLIHDDG